jgi:hypothetical protein
MALEIRSTNGPDVGSKRPCVSPAQRTMIMPSSIGSPSLPVADSGPHSGPPIPRRPGPAGASTFLPSFTSARFTRHMPPAFLPYPLLTGEITSNTERSPVVQASQWAPFTGRHGTGHFLGGVGDEGGTRRPRPMLAAHTWPLRPSSTLFNLTGYVASSRACAGSQKMRSSPSLVTRQYRLAIGRPQKAQLRRAGST